MVEFNGVDLETAVSGIMIEDIRVNPPQLAPMARARGIQAGSEFVRTRDETRTITITFAILEKDGAARQAKLDALTEWACIGEVHPMALPYRDGRLIDVTCTMLPQPSTRQWWESKLGITFTAFEPYFYAATEKTAACGTAFTVGGTVPPIMWITDTLASAAARTYSDGTNTMTFSSVRAGNLVIDLNRQTAAVGGVSVLGSLSYTSKFIEPKAGTLTITGSGTVHYKERWR